MNLDEVLAQIQTALPDVKLRKVADSILVEVPNDLVRVVRYLKESADFRLDYLASVTGADYLAFLEAVYHLYSVEKKSSGLTLRARTSREEPKLPSLTPIYRGAELQEREIYDMYGIHFVGHPDLRRLFMWDNFEGFPLRKDYRQENSEVLDKTDVQWLNRHHIQTAESLIQNPASENPPAGTQAPEEK